MASRITAATCRTLGRLPQTSAKNSSFQDGPRAPRRPQSRSRRAAPCSPLPARRGPVADPLPRLSRRPGGAQPRGAPACAGGPDWAARRVPAKSPALPRPPAGMSDGDNRCERGVRGCSGVPEFGASGPRGQRLPLETALLAPQQPREVAPRPASCSLVKPGVTSPTSPSRRLSPKGEKRGRRAVHGALHNRPRSPPQPSEGRRRWPLSRALVRTPHAHPDLPHALPLRRPSSATPAPAETARPRRSPASGARPPRRLRRRRCSSPPPRVAGSGPGSERAPLQLPVPPSPPGGVSVGNRGVASVV